MSTEMVLPTNKQTNKKDKIDNNKKQKRVPNQGNKNPSKNNKRWLNNEETSLTFSNHSQRRREDMIEP